MTKATLKRRPLRATPATQPAISSGDAQQGGWGVEKRLRIEFIVGTMVLLAGYVWYAGKIDNKIENQEDRLARLERIADITATASNRLDVRLTKMETTSTHIIETLGKIDRTLTEINRKAR